MFGREAGKLLFEEAETESSFMSDNVLQLCMEPMDSEDFTAEQRLKAKSNARNINNQICRLVRIFESKAMQDKLELVKVPRNSNNDISSYL
jgi:hypothetical protein